MRASRWLMAGLFVGSTVLVVSAQQPGGGFGGKGGGVNITSQVATNTALQDDLKLTDAQKAKLKVVADAAKKRTDAFKAAQGDKDKMMELFAEMKESMPKEMAENAKLIDETLTADQKARVKQIERQAAGVRVFAKDEMVADLKLSDTQKTKVKGIVEEYVKDSQGLGGFGGGKGGGGGFDKEKMAEAQKKREKLEKGAMADIDEVLNDDQRKTWKDLAGAPFDRSKLTQPGFGGGFGGGGFGGNKGKNNKKTD